MKSTCELTRYANRTKRVLVNPHRKTAIVQCMGNFYCVLYKTVVRKIDENYLEVHSIGLEPKVKRSVYL